jgi:hypothetical protein
MTLSIMRLSIMKLSIIKFRIMALSISAKNTTLGIKCFTLSEMLIVMMLIEAKRPQF